MNHLIECENCGALIMSKSRVCPTCGAPVKKQKKKTSFIIPIIIMALLFLGYSYLKYSRESDPHVLFVKNGSPNAFPDITFDEAFTHFFGSPSWKYFRGSRGNSSDTFDIVEFTGNCTYLEQEVTAKLQFTLDVDNGTFETTYLAFNDVPQSNDLLYALIEKAFTSYQESSEMAANKAIPVS